MSSIGFYLRYQPSESSFLGLQLASFLRAKGKQVSILSMGPRASHLHPDFDSTTITDKKLPFKQWSSNLSHVVFINDLSAKHLAKLDSAKSIFIASWDDPIHYAALYPKLNQVVCLSPSLARRLTTSLSLTNVGYVPLHLPSISPVANQRVLNPAKPRILLHLRTPRSHQLGSALIPTISKWIHQLPAEWTIWVPKSLMHPKSYIHKAFTAKHPDSSIRLIHQYDWDSQRLIFGSQDLTILPTLHGGHGMSVVLSLTMGTPVISLDCPPANEYLCKATGILSPCQVHYSTAGIAEMVPDLARFHDAVYRVISTPSELKRFKKNTSKWFEERQRLFQLGWSEILS